MEVQFTNAEGKRIHWDGVLWSSTDAPEAARMLNHLVLPEPGQHISLLEVAAETLRKLVGRVTHEILDDTGWPAEYLGADVFFEDPALAAEGEFIQTKDHDNGTKTGTEKSTLAAAQAFLSGSVCADGSDDGDADWEGPEREWADLIHWAKVTGRVLTGPGPARKGGREHDVSYDEATGSWIKFTKPDAAGFTVDWRDDGSPYLRNALPSEYLDRLEAHNALMEDRIELLGLWQEGSHSWRIVTRQPDVPGTRLTMDEIRRGMEAMGFVRLRWTGIGYEHSEAWRIGHTLLWDVHPANVVRSEGNCVVPIDVIITKLPRGYAPEHFHTLES